MLPLQKMIHLWGVFPILIICIISSPICNDANCSICNSSSPSSCQTCNSGHLLKLGTCCSSIMENCTSCSASPTICDSCYNNSFFLIGGDCKQCSALIDYCSTCSNSTNCIKCIKTHAMGSNNTCVACSTLMPNCVTCSSASACSTCINSNYPVSFGKCLLCSFLMTGCVTCNSESICTSCKVHQLVLNSSKCLICSIFLPNCLTCSSSTVCLTCFDSTYTVNFGSCVACSVLITNCILCSSSNTCISCNSRFGVNLNTNLCQPCFSLIDNCINCVSGNVCTKCVNDTFYINSTNKCQVCISNIPNCLTCSSSTQCHSCINDTLAVNPVSNQCQPCNNFISYCTNCYNSTICTACIASVNIIFNNSKCVPCSAVMPNCLNCTRTNYCTLCSKYNLLVYSSSIVSSCAFCGNLMAGCIDCPSQTVCNECIYGEIVIGGCSTVFGCKSVIQNASVSVCTACDSSFFQANPVDGKCVCKVGRLAGKYCTQIVGCTNIIRTVNGDECIACSQVNYFYLKNGQCYCYQYYQLKGQKCIDICGDGIKLSLPCDDGNLVSGDGCSSTCQVQPMYNCGATRNFSSICVYKGQIELKVVCVYKLEDNTAKIVLVMNPYVPNIHKSSIKLSSSLPDNCLMTSYQSIGSSIFVYVSYQANIQGSIAYITLQFDSNYISSLPASTPVKMNQCTGDELLYEPIIKSYKQMIMLIVKILSYTVLIVWLFGSYSHKMIGVETLHTFQFIIISQVFTSRYIPVFQYFNLLTNILNLFQNSFTNEPTLSSTSFNRLEYHQNFINNSLIVTAFQLLCLIIFILAVFINKYSQTKSQQKSKETKFQRECSILLSKFKKIIYNFLVFPLFIGFYFNLVISVIIHLMPSIEKNSNFVQQLVFLFIVFITNIIFFYEWRYMLVECNPEDEKRYNEKYIPIYLTNLLIFSFIIAASLAGLMFETVYTLAGTTFAYTFIVILLRPYSDQIHNISIIINQIGVCLNFGWIIMQKFLPLTKSLQQTIALILIGWMIVILVFAIIRTIYQLSKPNSQKIKVITAKSGQPNDNYQQQINNAINQQIGKNANMYRIDTQITREKQLEQLMREKKNRKEKIQQLRKILKTNILKDKFYYEDVANGKIQQPLKKPLKEK